MRTARTRSWLAAVRPAAATCLAAALPLVGVAALAWLGPGVADWLDAQPGALAIAAVIAAGAVCSGAALLPTHAVSLAAGWLFGVWLGPAVAWVAIVVAMLGCYTLGRRLAGTGLVDGLSRRVSNGSRLALVQHALTRQSPGRTATLVALVRLSPLAPFAATNVALAAVGVGVWPFLGGSAVGLAPRIIVVALLGAGMAELDWSKPQSPLLVTAGIAATLVGLVVIGRAARRALRGVMQAPLPSAASAEQASSGGLSA